MYTVLNFHWTPSQFANMTRKEKAFIIACIDNKIKVDKDEMDKIKR